MRIKLIIISLIMTLSAFGQKEHLSFMNVPIAGIIKDFNKTNKTKGYTYATSFPSKITKRSPSKEIGGGSKNCKATIRQHEACAEVSSIYIHSTL